MTTQQEAIAKARKGLEISVYVMETYNWNCNSIISNDMKRKAYKLNKEALAALDAVSITNSEPISSKLVDAVKDQSEDVRDMVKGRELVGYQFQANDGKWYLFLNDQHYENTVKDGGYPIRAIYTAPPSAEEPEPVAWMIKFKSDKTPEGFIDVRYHGTNAISDYRKIDPDATVTPLYETPPREVK